MSQEWYVLQDGQQIGPYTWEQLWQQARSGVIRSGDLTWKEGMAGWIQVDQVPGLANFPAAAVTAPPPPAADYAPAATAIPGAKAPRQAAPVNTGKGLLIAIVLAAVLLVAGGGSAAYYFFFRDRGLPAADTENNIEKPEPDSTEEPLQDIQKPPAEVVNDFILATLGSLPEAVIDYDKAKTLMTAAYAAAFDSPEFVPHVYGIQEGPLTYEIADGYLEGSTMEQFVWGFWGDETAMQWLFTLYQESGAWKIADIAIITAATPGGEAAVQTPFWQLNPVTTEFTVYQNGGWKLVVEFDHPSEDINALLEVVYYRADDGTIAYAQEMSGVITTGHGRLTLDSDYSGYDLITLGFQSGKHRVVAYIDGIEIASGELMVTE